MSGATMIQLLSKPNWLPVITKLKNPFEDDDEITKGTFWIEPSY
jgi:hypothetical protein